MSSSRPNRRSHGTSDTAYSISDRPGKPAPTVTTSRPADRWSMEASSCAAVTGRRKAGSSTAVPSVTRSVTGARAASMASGSIRGPISVSLAQTES